MSRSRLASSGWWRWGPLVLWIAIISAGSTGVLASDETSRFILPFLRWLLPNAESATLNLAHAAIRKLGHVTEFAILAVLWYRGLNWERQARWPSAALGAFALTLVFAGLDEVHQTFVATRTGSVTDVGWDGLGALCGVIGSGVLRARGGTVDSPNSSAPEGVPPGRRTVPFDD